MRNSDDPCHIPGTWAVVDRFNVNLPFQWRWKYFLSHFHGDHYTKLSATWRAGVIYCSPETAALVIKVLFVKPSFVTCLSLNTPHMIACPSVTEKNETLRRVNKFSVTLIDANHCPGAVMFLFELPDGKRYLHTGDFRYQQSMMENVAISRGPIDGLFLDTTYANPSIFFPEQAHVIQRVVSLVSQRICEDSIEGDLKGQSIRTLFLIGAYNIGREKIFLALGESLKLKVYVDRSRTKYIDCLRLSSDQRNTFTCDIKSPVHIVPMNFCGTVWPYFRPNLNSIKAYMEKHGLFMHFKRVLGVMPTGWANGSDWNKRHDTFSSGVFEVRLVPYSEHSSLSELKNFVQNLRPKRIIPTVYASPKQRTDILNLLNGNSDKIIQASKQILLDFLVKENALSKRTAGQELDGPDSKKKAIEASDYDSPIKDVSNCAKSTTVKMKKTRQVKITSFFRAVQATNVQQ